MDKEHWIKAILSNDEYSSDEELVELFVKEGGLSEEEAKRWVSKRSLYSNHIVLNDGRIYDPRLRHKTNQKWYSYQEWGSYFKLENGFLLQCPMNTDGTADEASFCEVDWERGVNPEEIPRLLKIAQELGKKA